MVNAGLKTEVPATPASLERPTGARGWLARWRSLQYREDTEHELALFRVVLLFGACVLLLAGYGGAGGSGLLLATVASFVFLAISIAILLHVFYEPDISVRRRVLSIFVDQLFCTAFVTVLNEPAAPVLGMYLVVAVGNALRYGKYYGYLASAVAAIGFGGVIELNGYWHRTGMLGFAWLFAILIVPPYVSLLGERIAQKGHEYRRRAKEMARAATQDNLTGLANRGYFAKLLNHAVRRARETDGVEGFAVLYCDLDGFKSVNDSYGHHVGDLLLRQVADILKTCVRGTDVVARLGGDEFAILLSRITDPEIAKRIGAVVVNRMKTIDSVEGRPVVMSCSVGIAMSPAEIDEVGGDNTLENVLAAADEAMYCAKRAGKNRCHLGAT